MMSNDNNSPLAKNDDLIKEHKPRFRLFRGKFRENPSVPIGLILGAGAVGYGIYNYRQNLHLQTRFKVLKIFQTRVFAQGVVLSSMFIGCIATYMKATYQGKPLKQVEEEDRERRNPKD